MTLLHKATNAIFCLCTFYGLALGRLSQSADVPHSADPVLDLTTRNFAKYTNSSEFIFVKFFVPWCIHCQRLAAPFHRLAVKNPQVRFGAVNCDLPVNSELTEKHVREGYPTIILFRDGHLVEEYSGPRDLESMDRFLNDTIAFARRELITAIPSGSGIEDFFSSIGNRPALVAVKDCPGAIDDFQLVFNRTAHVMRVSTAKRVAFAYISALNGPCVISRRAPDAINMTMKWDPSHEESLDVFMHVSTLRYPVGHLTPENARYVISSSVPLLIYFEERQSVDSDMIGKLGVVIERRADVIALLARASEFVELQRHIGFGEKEAKEESPPKALGSNGLALYFGGGPKIERLVLAPQLELGALLERVNWFTAWGVEGTRGVKKSSEITTNVKTGSLVEELSAKEWRRAIVRSNRDTVLEVYRRNCSDCPRYASALDEVAKYIQHTKRGLKVARIDVTKNHLPLDLAVKRYPALILLKSGKDRPVVLPYSIHMSPREILSLISERRRDRYKKQWRRGSGYFAH